MKFMAGESAVDFFERLMYRGGIGIFYNSTFGGIIAWILFFAICICTIVGAVTIIKWIVKGRKRPMDPHEKWLKTGKM